MAERRAPYFHQLESYIGILPESTLRLTRYGTAIEVRRPIEITIRWKVKTKTGWKDYEQVWRAEPGDVLHPIWRKLTSWENEDFQKTPDNWKEIGIVRIDGQLLIRTVSFFPDLWTAYRQEMRHIPPSLTQREVQTRKGVVVVAGDSVQMKSLAETLDRIVKESIRGEKALQTVAAIYEELRNARAPSKVQARDVLIKALEAPPGEIPDDLLLQVVQFLRQREETDIRMAKAVLEKAKKWLRIIRKIEMGFEFATGILGNLIKELEPFVFGKKQPEARTLLQIGQQAVRNCRYLHKVATFNPYYDWVHSPPVMRLLKAEEYALAGETKKLYNALKGALVRIEKGFRGETNRSS